MVIQVRFVGEILVRSQSAWRQLFVLRHAGPWDADFFIFAQTKPERQSKAAKATQSTSSPTASASGQNATAESDSSKPEDKLFKGMKYRLIGPFRGGRSLTAAGIPGRSDDLLFRRDRRRSMEIHRWRDDLVASIRQRGNVLPSAVWPWRIRITTSSMWERARLAFAAISPMAMACISRSMAARPGKTLGCTIRAPSAKSSSIRRILILFLLPRWDIPTDRIPSAEFSARPMAARPGRKFCTKMKTPAASM